MSNKNHQNHHIIETNQLFENMKMGTHSLPEEAPRTPTPPKNNDKNKPHNGGSRVV